jgi:hypothetical protein
LNWIILVVASFLAIGCSGQTRQGARQDPPSGVLGRWQVIQVFCPTCNGTDKSDNGTIIDLGKMTIVNPFGGDCPRPPGYNLLKVMPPDLLIQDKGQLWSKQLTDELRRQKSVTYGYITCNGMNHMRMIFTGNDRAYYLWEGDRVFVLARK